MDGIINIYKEKDFTSHDVVAKMRGILKTRKIGHTGTLDPQATGVLPVCVGQATKLVELLTDHDKVYEAEITFGMETDTQDIFGKILNQCDETVLNHLSENKIKEAILSFVGPYNQVPPMYSALKVDGRKLCDLARQGIVIERQPRPVTVFDIEIISVKMPKTVIRAHVSKGTYIRTLIHDIGQVLGVGACMSSLQRVRVANFKLEDSITLSKLQELSDSNNLESAICTLDQFFASYKAYKVLPEWERFLVNGNEIRKEMVVPFHDGTNNLVVIYDTENVLKGLYRFDEQKNRYCPVKMFL